MAQFSPLVFCVTIYELYLKASVEVLKTPCFLSLSLSLYCPSFNFCGLVIKIVHQRAALLAPLMAAPFLTVVNCVHCSMGEKRRYRMVGAKSFFREGEEFTK